MTIPTPLKRLAKSLLPASVLNRHRARKVIEEERANFGGTLQETFSKIYSEELWGSSDTGFFSGFGSHEEAVIAPYVAAVRSFVCDLRPYLNAVDLGCGDFNIGRQIRDMFVGYTGCDIVADLVTDNRRRYADLDVDFRVIDIVADPLPPGDVVFVRQVLQHLSNDDIRAVLAKIGTYEYAIVTDHLPRIESFKSNVDKPSGAHTRVNFGSGIVLTEPPFALMPLSQQVLCEVPDTDGVKRTIAYKLR